MNDEMKSVMRRINKLMAMAEDGRGNENEASSAALMAAKLMEKYQIDNKELIIARLKNENEFGEEVYESSSSSNRKWVGYLQVAIHYLFDVKVSRFKNRKGMSYRFQGFKDDVEVASYAFESLINKVIAEANTCNRAGKISGVGGSASFKIGAASEIQRRAKKMKIARNQKTSGIYEIVLAKDDAISRYFGNQRFKSTSYGFSNQNGCDAGRDFGSKVDIGQRGVSSSGNNGQLRLT